MRVEIPDKMLPFVTETKRHKIARGGRGSGKSWSIARILVARAVQRRTRWLCCRETQKSTKESSHRLLADTINELGVAHLFDVQQTIIKGPHGSEFHFVGLQDHTSESIKSYEGFDGAWCEESSKITERSANVLIPTIRMPGSEVWWSYNPDLEEDYIHLRAERPTDDTLVVTINYDDNPWFPAELEAERVKMLAIDKDMHDHVYGGKCRSILGLMFKRHWLKRFRDAPANLNNYMASDFAQTPEGDDKNDPDWTEHGCFGMDANGDTWVHDWWSGQTDLDTSLDAWFAMVRRNKPLVQFDEKGGILNMLSPIRNRMMRERQTFVRCESLASVQDKAYRAQGFAARAAAGTIYIKEGEWGDRLVNQLCAFSGRDGQTDDAVDACSLFARGLDYVANARPDDKAKKAKAPPVLSHEWFEARERMDRESQPENFYL